MDTKGVVEMNQQKMGEFLKRLRKDKGLTQEQLAELFAVSTRTVSRWETGRNIPDVDMLLALADFYNVDVGEIICGERKPVETRDAMRIVSEYAAEKEKKTQSSLMYVALGTAITLLICSALFANGTAGLLYGVIPETICDSIRIVIYGTAVCLVISCLSASLWRGKPAKEPRKTVAATVLSKEVKAGTYGAGRSQMGYSFAINFLTKDGQTIELFAYDYEFGRLKEGMKGTLTYQGRCFVDFK